MRKPLPKVLTSSEAKVTTEGEDDEKLAAEKDTKKESRGRNDRGGMFLSLISSIVAYDK